MTPDWKGALQCLIITSKTFYQVLKIFYHVKVKKTKVSKNIRFKKTKFLKKSVITKVRI